MIGHGGWFGGWLWHLVGVSSLTMLVFWGAVVAGLFLLSRPRGGVEPPQRPDSATEILKRRYAQGEIARDQYEQMRKDLDA